VGGTSGLGMVNPGVAGVSDFEALVRGTTNPTSNGLGARGRQVDIFSDESPVRFLSSVHSRSDVSAEL